MAEVLLRHRLAEADPTAAVSSAGLHAAGSPATAYGVDTMRDRGLDLSDHRSRQIDAALLGSADLILGMAREHIREVAVIDPEALARSFTLKELVRRGEAVGGRRADEDLPRWLDRVGAGRRREDLLGVGHDPAFDIEDPVGQSRQRYQATAAEIDGLLGRLVAVAWPPPERRPAALQGRSA